MKNIKPFFFHPICFLVFFLALTSLCETTVSNLEVNSYTQGISSDSIKGKVKIDNQFYNVICDCNDEDKKDETDSIGPACDPSKIKILEDRSGEGAAFDQVRNLVGHPTELDYTDVLRTPFYCLDGRINKPVLSALGGDMGEFILAMAIYHELVSPNKELDQDTVDHYFSEYIKYMKPDVFIMCTDDDSVNHLQKQLSVEGLNLNNPRTQIQAETLEALTQPENNGDIHIRMLLKYPDMYAINGDLVKMAVRAFYKQLWNKQDPNSSKLKLEILMGEHSESAFLEVRSNEACTKARLAPLISPKEVKKDGLSIFINHLDAVSVLRVELAKFFANYIGHHQQGLEPDILYNRMKHHGLAFLEVTGSFVAKSLPFYSMNIM